MHIEKGGHILKSFCVFAKHYTGVLYPSPQLFIATVLWTGCRCTHFAEDHRGEATLQIELEGVGCEPRSTWLQRPCSSNYALLLQPLTTA